MSSNYNYDLIVIGAGIAGMVSVVTACGHTNTIANNIVILILLTKPGSFMALHSLRA
jgi:succinate dehydrogenase/fumarate reductase flavoprotein subunit